MAIREILVPPHPVLRTVATPVEKIDEALRILMKDMLDSMYAANGLGLAANQVGISKRAVVIDISGEDDPAAPEYFINPEIIWASEETAIYNEGCLSIPEFKDDVERPVEVEITYMDYDGNKQTRTCDGLMAVCIQHEIDHLNGVLFVDHISRLKRDLVLKKLTKQAKIAEQGTV